MESLKKDVHRPITILLWDYMTHHWVNVFDLGDNSTKKWVQKIHMGTFTYSDVLYPLPNILRRAWKHGGIAAVVSILVGFAFG